MGGKWDISILINKTELLFRSDQWGPRVTRELLELLLAQKALNKEGGAKLSTDWIPACELLKGKNS